MVVRNALYSWGVDLLAGPHVVLAVPGRQRVVHADPAHRARPTIGPLGTESDHEDARASARRVGVLGLGRVKVHGPLERARHIHVATVG